MSASPNYTILSRKQATEAEFVEFWSSLYKDPRDALYRSNIGKRLTPGRILKLFEWKNGGPIAEHKQESIHRNYIETRPHPPTPGDRDGHVKFITRAGGAIWRIFWLHCYDHVRYPIFDQHVYRAMFHLQTGKLAELPDDARERAVAYYDHYLPFYRLFSYQDNKRVDEALWSYGKYLSRYAI